MDWDFLYLLLLAEQFLPRVPTLYCRCVLTLRLLSWTIYLSLQSSRAVLVQRATGDPSDSSLMPALLWLLLSQQLLLSPSLDQQTACAVLDVILCSLKQADSPASLQTALDGLSVALALPEVEGCVGEVWLAAVIPLVAALLDRDGNYLLTLILYQFLTSTRSRALWPRPGRPAVALCSV